MDISLRIRTSSSTSGVYLVGLEGSNTCEKAQAVFGSPSQI